MVNESVEGIASFLAMVETRQTVQSKNLFRSRDHQLVISCFPQTFYAVLQNHFIKK